ncbi:hypothetical protein [Azospirillum melinis]
MLIARILADDVVVLVAALMAVLWVWGRRDGRGALVTAGCALLVAAVVSTLIGAVRTHPRPFMVGLVPTLLPHAAETSLVVVAFAASVAALARRSSGS